jgi:hypothetical protein
VRDDRGGLARRLSVTQWAVVESGLGDVHAAALAAQAPARAAALCESVTIRPPRISRRRTLPWTGSGTGTSGRGGRS